MPDPIQSRLTPPSYDPPDASSLAPHTPLASPTGGTTPPALDASLDRLIQTQVRPSPEGAAYANFVRTQTAAVSPYAADANTRAIQTKLDTLKAEATPTYRLPNGSEVAVPHFFRMAGPTANVSPEVAENQPFRYALAKELKVSSDFESGRPSLADVKALTQGLIDEGKLGNVQGVTGSELVLAVHRMAWDFGVGIDCAGYTQRALYASQGGNAARYGLKSLQNEDLMSLAVNPHWRSIGLREARPGDVVTLNAASGDVGHAAILYEHQIASVADRVALRARLAAPSPDANITALLSAPVIHVYQLDSSWGTGKAAVNGAGVDRRTWLYAEGVGWACQRAGGAFVFDGARPNGHPLGGFFRPKVTP